MEESWQLVPMIVQWVKFLIDLLINTYFLVEEGTDLHVLINYMEDLRTLIICKNTIEIQ